MTPPALAPGRHRIAMGRGVGTEVARQAADMLLQPMTIISPRSKQPWEEGRGVYLNLPQDPGLCAARHAVPRSRIPCWRPCSGLTPVTPLQCLLLNNGQASLTMSVTHGLWSPSQQG